MDIKEALSLFNLDENFTDEKLNEVYKNKREAEKKIYEEKIKTLEDAKKCLKEYLKERDCTYVRASNQAKETSKEKLELENLRLKYMAKILEEAECIFKISNRDKVFMENKKYFLKITTEYMEFLSSALTEEGIKERYNLFKERYYKVLDKYVNELNHTLFHFPIWHKLDYSSLDKLRTSLKLLIEEELKKHISNIYSYENKVILNMYFEQYKEKYIISCLYGEITFDDAKEDLSIELHQAIINYKKRTKLLESLMRCEKEIGHDIITTLETSLRNPDAFDVIYSQINNSIKIKGKIRKIIHR